MASMLSLPDITNCCSLCGAFIVIKSNSGQKYASPHSAEECPLKTNHTQLVSILQTLNNELASSSIDDIVRSERLTRVALRKALIECAIHQLQVRLTFRGSQVSTFELPPDVDVFPERSIRKRRRTSDRSEMDYLIEVIFIIANLSL